MGNADHAGQPWVAVQHFPVEGFVVDYREDGTVDVSEAADCCWSVDVCEGVFRSGLLLLRDHV